MAKKPSDPQGAPSPNRRGFLGAATLGAGAALTGLASAPAQAEVQFPTSRTGFGGGGSAGLSVNRSEIDLYDCEIEGKLPADLDGAFYRVGPDPQYPKPDKYSQDIAFDGEGHISMFRIKGGHVDYKTRYAKNQRWKAQHAARKSLFGMYRNPLTDDPSVKGLSRGTANTQIFYHHGKILAFKEDSPPVAMDPITLDTTDDYYTFGGGMKGLTHTAHPKIDPKTGGYISFGYEAKGLATDDIYVFEADSDGHIHWDAFVKAPYAGMIHDFAVTEHHIAFFACPMATNMDQIRASQVHFGWDSSLASYMGVMRRGGDGSDMRWFTGQQLMCTHTMGAWDEGDKVIVDMDGGEGNQFPFFPSLHEPFSPEKSLGRLRRFTMDLSRPANTYQVETLYPEITGQLARQDDRFHTLPYRYGYLQTSGATGSGWAVFDHQLKTVKVFKVPDYALSEMCFVPRHKGAAEGDGYLIGIGGSLKESGRSDLILVDAQNLDAGPIARVKMPYKVVGQVHGFWVAGWQLPKQA